MIKDLPEYEALKQLDRQYQGSGLAPPKSEKEPRITIENASEGEFIQGGDDGRGILTLRGRIRVRLPNGSFTANTVIIDSDRQEIYGEGNLIYRAQKKDEPYTEIRAERLIYDQRLGTGIVYNAEGFVDPVYFIGRSISITDNSRIAISHAHFTSCAAERPHYHFTARKIWLYEDKKIVAVGVLYYVGGIPLLPLPFLYASDWGTGIISQAGYSQVQGFFLQNTYQFTVPTAYLSSWKPVSYRVMLDYYENTGEVLGLEMFRFSPNLNYYTHVSAARFRRYDLVSDYREQNRLLFTNKVIRDDGTVGRDYRQWYKAFMVMNLKQNTESSNDVRNVHMRFEDYSHFLYDFEYGSRYQPTSTIPALYQNSESGRGLIHMNTDWNITWNESRDDLNMRVEVKRDRKWINQKDYLDGEYEPVKDVVPDIDITKNVFLGRDDYFDLPFYWDNTLHTDLTRTYYRGDEFSSINHNYYQSMLRTYWSMYPFISVNLSGGWGIQKWVPYGGASNLERDAKYNSYQYWLTRAEVTTGPDVFYLKTVHTDKKSFKEELKYEPFFNYYEYNSSQRIKETSFSLVFNPVNNMQFSLNTAYDHRKQPSKTTDSERWYYPVFRSDIYIDFLNLFKSDRENLMSRKKVHFIGMRIANDYVYDYVNKIDHSNVFGVTFEAGGFDLWLLKRLRYVEASFYWHHVYYNPDLDHMRYTFKLDVQLTDHWYFETELESRATEVERYRQESIDDNGDSDYVAFEHDLVNGTGVNGNEKRQDSVFNVGYFEAALVVDLHEWEFRTGYAIEQRSIYAHVNSLEVVNFYDNRIFFSLTLLRFDIEGVGNRPSKYILNKKRVTTTDLGRASVYNQGL